MSAAAEIPVKMSDSNAIVWVRNDQRIQDNLALTSALEENEAILPVYVLDERLFSKNQLADQRASQRRLSFLGQSLQDLRTQYQNLGGDLLCLEGNVAETIINIAKANHITKIYTSTEYSSEELKDENQIRAAGLNLICHDQGTLVKLNQLPFSVENTPDIFTEFRKKVEKKCVYEPPIIAPKRINAMDEMDYSVSEKTISKLLSQPSQMSEKGLHFKGGETEALKRLDHFIWQSQAISHYKETRNELLGWDYSSKFSVWLANGNISSRTIQKEINKFEAEVIKNSSTYWLTFELLWRDYFKFMGLKFGTRLFKAAGFKNKMSPSFVLNEVQKQDLENWKNGNTNMPFVDANMRGLNATGFMSNRGRQVVASYLVHDLELPWLLGAAYFEHHLLDYDPCSNYGNWQYVAGVGNDPRPNRYFNTVLQAQRYDEHGTYAKYWLPELEGLLKTELFEPWKFKPDRFRRPKMKQLTSEPN